MRTTITPGDTDDGPKVHVDKQGRITDKQGRPLRNKDHRSYGKQPFKGKNGKPHPRQARLEARQKAFDDAKQHSGMKRPGSLNK